MKILEALAIFVITVQMMALGMLFFERNHTVHDLEAQVATLQSELDNTNAQLDQAQAESTEYKRQAQTTIDELRGENDRAKGKAKDLYYSGIYAASAATCIQVMNWAGISEVTSGGYCKGIAIQIVDELKRNRQFEGVWEGTNLDNG